MTEPGAFTIAGAAAYSAVSEKTVRRAIGSGDLPAKYPTSRPVILRADLDAWLQAAPDQPRRAS